MPRSRQFRRALTLIAGAAVATAAFVGLVPATPAGAAGPTAYAIVESDGCRLARVDLTVGSVEEFGPLDSDHCVFDLAVSPDGASLYGVRFVPNPEDDGEMIALLMHFDATTGVATNRGQIGDFAIGTGPEELQGTVTFDSAGNLLTYIVPDVDIGGCGADAVFCLFRITNLAAPGGATVVGPTTQEMTIYFGLGTSCAGSVVTVRQGEGDGGDGGDDIITPGADGWVRAAQPVGGSFLNTVNTANGSTTDAPNPLGTGFEIQSLDFDSDGVLWALGFTEEDTGNVYTINPTTGVATVGPALQSQSVVIALAIARTCVPAAAPEVILLPAFTG